MKEVRFSRADVKRGDLLCFAGHPERPLRFKFMGFKSDVVATWITPPPGKPDDVIVRQRDVRILREPA